MHLFLIGLFGGFGCISRYLVSGWVHAWLGRDWPYGTLTVNILGSLLLGLIMEGSLRTALLGPEVRMGITVGFMGGFTTFSTFSYETVRLLEDGSWLLAGANATANLIFCLLGAGIGIMLARQL